MHSLAADLVDSLAARERTGLVFVDEYGHRRDYTFGEIATQSLRYAAVLRAFGVQPEEHVCVCLPATPKCAFTLLALARIGARARVDEPAVADATTIIAGRKTRVRIDEMREQLPEETRYFTIGEEREGWARLDTVAQAAARARSAADAGSEDAWAPARADAREELGAIETDVVWCALPMGDEWFERALVRPWLCASTAVLHDAPFDARERLDLVRELDVTVLLQDASDYRAELALRETAGFKMPRLRRCIAIGDGDASLQARWHERFGLELTSLAAV